MLTNPLTTSRTRAPSHMVTSKATTHRAPAIAKLTKVETPPWITFGPASLPPCPGRKPL
ncbi:unnamed protein product [Ectocarpus sp. 12 AP-2014]